MPHQRKVKFDEALGSFWTTLVLCVTNSLRKSVFGEGYNINQLKDYTEKVQVYIHCTLNW